MSSVTKLGCKRCIGWKRYVQIFLLSVKMSCLHWFCCARWVSLFFSFFFELQIENLVCLGCVHVFLSCFYAVKSKLFSVYELVVDVVECRWCVWMFHLRFKIWLSTLCLHNTFMPLFAMNQIYGCLLCMKALDIIRIKMVVLVVSVVLGYFFSLR